MSDKRENKNTMFSDANHHSPKSSIFGRAIHNRHVPMKYMH